MAHRLYLTGGNPRNDARMDSLLSDLIVSAKYFVFALLLVTLIGQFVIVHRRVTQQSGGQQLPASPVAFAYDSDTVTGADSLQLAPEMRFPNEGIVDSWDIADPAEDLAQFFFERRPAMYHIAYSD